MAVAALTFIRYAGAVAFPNGDHTASKLGPRAECKPYKIVSGDSCTKIASTGCGGIKVDDLYRYNEGLKDKCSNLKVSYKTPTHMFFSLVVTPFSHNPVGEIVAVLDEILTTEAT